MQREEVQIVKIISEHKKRYHGEQRPAPGFKRVMAAVKLPGSKKLVTKHVDTQDGKTGFAKI